MVEVGTWGNYVSSIQVVESGTHVIFKFQHTPLFEAETTVYQVDVFHVPLHKNATFRQRLSEKVLVGTYHSTTNAVKVLRETLPYSSISVDVAVMGHPAKTIEPAVYFLSVPEISFVQQPSQLSTVGGQTVRLFGNYIGSVEKESVRAVMASEACSRTYELSCNYRDLSNGMEEHLECLTVEGVGYGFSWRVNVRGKQSSLTPPWTSYSPPIITSFIGEVSAHPCLKAAHTKPSKGCRDRVAGGWK